mmetsp:Transcript_3496/g.5453  ORF Transcript_3496/g.5453 Transcript_3496/m.5453 type:complete len:442 (-) Transcript_3496:26-1351(-)
MENVASNTHERNEIPAPTATPNDIATADVQSALNVLKGAAPFIILLLLRFILAYATRILFLACVFIVQYRLHNALNDEVSLKGSASKKVVWTLCIVSVLFLLSVVLFSPFTFKSSLWPRFLLFPFESEHVDFIGIVWLTCLTDISVRMAVNTLKMILWLTLLPYGEPAAPTVLLSARSCARFFSFPSILTALSSGGSTIRTLLFWRRHRDSTPAHSHTDDIETGAEEGYQHTRSTSLGLVSRSVSSRRRTSDSEGDLQILTSGQVYDSSSLCPEPFSTGSRQREVTGYLRLKRAFMLIDTVALAYRSILPLPLWVCYFSQGPGADVLPVAYVCVKLLNLSFHLRISAEGIGNYFAGRTEHGTYATEVDVERSGSSSCSICFDPYLHPVSLPCSHVFCEHCIYEWLDSESSCPVCRADVRSGESPISSYIRESSSQSVPMIM